MGDTSDVFTTSYLGDTIGTHFADCPPPGDRSAAYLTKVIVCHNINCVHGLRLFYSWAKGEVIHGSEDAGESTSSEIIFDVGEFIIRIEGLSKDCWIKRLTFVTTTRTCGPFGVDRGQSFEWSGPKPGMRFLAFSGRADSYLRGLQATFCKSPNVTRSRTVQYEKLAALASVSNDASTHLRSTFTCRLMSPITTLYVGQERVQFLVHQDTLTKLPFFQAALLGQFREASENSISMPDDNPSTITAMIEFLYTGNYTYAYDPTGAQPQGGSATPVASLGEGLYHLGVHVVAAKYDAPQLSAMAVANFKSVGNELDGINALQLWKAAYPEDLRLPRSSAQFAEDCRGEGLVSWVAGLLGTHCEELEETISDCPQLATDLLRLATIGI